MAGYQVSKIKNFFYKHIYALCAVFPFFSPRRSHSLKNVKWCLTWYPISSVYVVIRPFLYSDNIFINNNKNCCLFLQCCGSMTYWCGSGSADPCLWPMDPDPDPAILVIDLPDANKKLIFYFYFFCYLLFEGTFTSFFTDKKSKRVTK